MPRSVCVTDRNQDCSHCGRSFSRLEHLQRHVRTRESPIVNSRRFRLAAGLNILVDTKEKPFRCSCGRAFARNDLLKRHKARDHEETTAISEEFVSTTSPHESNIGAMPVDMTLQDPSASRDASMNQQSTNTAPPFIDPISHGSSSNAYFFPEIFDEFTAFVESAGLDPSWEGVDLQSFDSDIQMHASMNTDMQGYQTIGSKEAMEDPDNLADMTPCHSRGTTAESNHSQTFEIIWKISEDQRQAFASRIADTESDLNLFRLPSKYALSRYFQSYTDMFHKHFPMLHMPTYSLETAPPELSLAIAAIGAQYRLEFSNGLELYHKAKDLMWKRLGQCHNLAWLCNKQNAMSDEKCGHPSNVCTIILLIAFSSWMQETELLSDALQLQAPLAHALHQGGLHEPEGCGKVDEWLVWIDEEHRRRAKLIGFAYLNIQTVIYNTPPLVFVNDINLSLPCPSAQWAATNPSDWRQLRARHVPAVSFQEAFRQMLLNQPITKGHGNAPRTCPLALFILLQGLLQKIHLARQFQVPGVTHLRKYDLELLE